MPRVLLAITIVAIWIYGILDCARTPKTSMPGRLPKAVWMIVAAVPIIGTLFWLTLSWPIKHPNGWGTLNLGGSRREQAPTPPIAPDDDPEFLAKLEARNRFAEWERQRAKHEANSKAKDDAEKAKTADESSAEKSASARKTSPDGDQKPDSPQASREAETEDLDTELRKLLEEDGGQV